LHLHDAQAIRQYDEIGDARSHPIWFLELRSASKSLDHGYHLLLSEVTFNLVRYPLAAVAVEPNKFHRLIVRFMNLHEVRFRAASIWMGLQRLESKGSRHVAEGVGWE
jgi:hypothetical protein